MKYTELTFTELVNKIGSSRYFDLPKMLKEAFRRLLTRVEALEDAPAINSALQSGDNISELTNDAGYLKLEKVVTQEIPIGIIDGTNNTFSTLTPLVTSTEKIFVNGQRQRKPEDYNISGQTINFTFSPQINETILIDYIKQ